MNYIRRADGNVAVSIIPLRFKGYIEEAERIAELKKMCRATVYESDSSESEHSDATEIIVQTFSGTVSKNFGTVSNNWSLFTFI